MLPPGKSWLDVADVGSKWLIPVAVVLTTWLYTSAQKSREQGQRDFEIAVTVLQSPPTPELGSLRKWALETFVSKTGISDSAASGLRSGAQLPAEATLQLPVPGAIRVSIVRPEGAPDTLSQKIAGALVSGGYDNVSLRERPSSSFPRSAEVRFYFPADSANAAALLSYVRDRLGIAAILNSRVGERDDHQPGDLNVYVK